MRISIALAAAAALHAQRPGVWETLTRYPLSVTEISGAAAGGRVYMMCGITAAGSTTAAYAFDTVNRGAWVERVPIPVSGGLDHCNVAASGNSIYLLGGLRFGSSFVSSGTFAYDTVANRWTQVAAMEAPRGASGVAAIGARIYVAGGTGPGGVTARVDVFDTVTNQWSRVADMPTAREHLTAQAVGGRLYAIAGRAGGRDLAVNEEYDPASNTWRARAPLPVARGGLGGGVVRGRIVVFGGEGASPRREGTFEEVDEYDPARDAWRTLAPMPLPRHGVYGVTVEDRVFVPGGGPVAGAFFSDHADVLHVPGIPAAPASVQNGASFEPGVAPGSIGSVFGESMTHGTVRAAEPVTTLNATQVRINDTPVPLFFVSPRQINFLVPASLGTGTHTLSIAYGGEVIPSAVRPVVRAVSIGLFALDGSGRGQGAILVAGTGLIARATRDAFSRAPRRGEAVEVYATGLGAGPPLEATVGGLAARVLYAGRAPGFPGLSQINLVVPDAAPAGIAVPVRVRIGESVSNEVTMAVVAEP